MKRALRIDGMGWLAIAAINIAHYAVLLLLSVSALLLVIAFLMHDEDHVRIRCRIDHAVDVWTGPHGAARKHLPPSCANVSEPAP